MTVVRNQAYTRGSCGVRERHNERKNECYSNADIQLERSPMNVYYKKPETTYEQAFDRLVGDGIIVVKGLKTDGSAKIIDEMIFDVNTSYFEENGGYEFAKKFYEEAYHLAVKEVGDERYILSAVMHADERNVAVSEEMGKDVFHYHLHVVYVPVVEKEVKWTKRCKDKDLVGMVKEVINQVSHSKKWPRLTQTDENGEVLRNEKGKAVLVNSYSLLQDRFYEHMRSAGFQDFERGKYKSTAKHLSDMEFKLQKDKERAAKLEQAIEDKKIKISDLDEKAEKKQKQLDNLEQKITPAKKAVATIEDIEQMGNKRTILGDIAISPTNWKKVSELAKEGLKSRGIIADLKSRISKLTAEIGEHIKKIFGLEKRLEQYETKKLGISDQMKYYQALNRAPNRMRQAIADIMRQSPENVGQARQPMQIKKQEISR